MLEIELKAKVSDRRAVEGRLAAFMTYSGEVDKQDEYWSLPVVSSLMPAIGFRLRLRTEPGKETVTFKEKTYTENIEINKEVEFGILDADAFRLFLEKMSARLLYRKSKSGTSWKGEGGVVAELVRVDDLGDFLEIETLCEDDGQADVEEIRKGLMKVLERCGVPASSIEARPYSQLLGMPKY